MKSLVHRLMFVGLAVVIALPIAAQQKDEKDKKKDGNGPVADIKKALADAGLTEEQKKKVEGIITEHAPKIAAAFKKAGDAPKMVAEARKKLKEEGKKGKELTEGSIAAAKLSAEQKAGFEDLQKATADLRSAVSAVLTDEQKEKAGFNKGKKKNQ